VKLAALVLRQRKGGLTTVFGHGALHEIQSGNDSKWAIQMRKMLTPMAAGGYYCVFRAPLYGVFSQYVAPYPCVYHSGRFSLLEG